jgi:hypothetical protein
MSREHLTRWTYGKRAQASTPPGWPCLYRQYRLAAHPAAAEGGECVGGLLPAEREADAGAQAAVGDQPGQDREVLTLGLLRDGADEADDPRVPGLAVEVADANLAGLSL